MKSTNYVMIQGWMCNELKLKGNELLVFALIHGFSQDGISKFIGGRKYIADTFNISLPTVDKALQSLVEKNYIKKEESDDFMNPNSYWINAEVVKKLYEGSKETLHGGSKETLLNNTSKQTKQETKKSNSKELLQDFSFGKTKKKPKKENMYTKCLATIQTFTQSEKLRNNLKTFLDLRLEMAKEENKPFYFGMWTSLLNQLRKLTFDEKANTINTELAIQIVEKSVIRGWKHFYELTDNFSSVKPWEEGVKSTYYTEDELEELERLNEEREKKGLRTRF